MKKLEQGISDFKEYIDSDCYFVDKTHLIGYLIDHPSKVHLITRPRRFGKTLNLSMIRYFFEAPAPPVATEAHTPTQQPLPNAYLFENFSIAQHPQYGDYLGQYPVIHLSFKNVKGNTGKAAMNSIQAMLADEFKRHPYLADMDILDNEELKLFRRIQERKGTEEDYAESLKNLSSWLNRAYGKPAYILLDEYDTPLQAAYSKNYYDEIIDFIRSFMVQTFKDNPHLKQAVVIGILKVAQESIFSDFNNPAVSTILDPVMEDCFGFTEEEVEAMASHFGLAEKMNGIKEWYNGYIFGGTAVVYNPWSIVNYLGKPTAGFRPYWSNTSDNELARKVLQLNRENSRSVVEQLLTNQEVRRKVAVNIAYPQIEGGSEELAWGFLLHSGYLKAGGMRQEYHGVSYRLAIPNREVEGTYSAVIKTWLNKDMQVNDHFLGFVQGVRMMDTAAIEENLAEILYSLASFHDTSGGIRKERKLVENFYHGLILGLLAYFGGEYAVESNREYGKGRADIVLVRKGPTPQNAEEALVFEFKQGKDSIPLETLAQAALDQALERYATAVREKWRPKTMLVLGVGFRGKELALCSSRC